MEVGNQLGIIGCGQMARALLGGFAREADLFSSILLHDIDPGKAGVLAKEYNAKSVESSRDLAAAANIILLAVKPGQVSTVLRQIVPTLNENKLLVSIAAGISIGAILHEVGRHMPVARVMPNTPCLLGQGMVALSPGTFVEEKSLALLKRMFSTVGLVEIVPEGYMDAVTAVSGSGPAYIFLVAEAMTDAAVEVGLPRDIARTLVNQTISGAVAMLQTGEHPSKLKDQVTSPGGTTIVGIRALESGGVRAAFFAAVREAFERSKALGQ
ncbi:MAG: pyrroline-5-carboxylate reductase [Acidobacteriota bacterium]